jgi:hypothetical protein
MLAAVSPCGGQASFRKHMISAIPLRSLKFEMWGLRGHGDLDCCRLSYGAVSPWRIVT